MKDTTAVGSTRRPIASKLSTPRVVWMMVPAGAVDETIADLLPHLERGDILIDGGNSYYVDDIRRAKALASKGIHYVEVGTSGGVWGLERGYCMMIGGETEVVKRLQPIFATLAPDAATSPTPGRDGRAAPQRRLPALRPLRRRPLRQDGAQRHRVRGDGRLCRGVLGAQAANIGKTAARSTPRPPHCGSGALQYDLDLSDIAELWRRGSVISSWLLDLSAPPCSATPTLSKFEGRVSDSGEGRWTIKAAIDEGVPAHVLTALYERFSPAARRTSATSCCLRCGSNSADTSRRRPVEVGRSSWNWSGMNVTDPASAEATAKADAAPAAPPCTMVIFGAAGDLTKRLVVPALYTLSLGKQPADGFRLVGVDLAAKTTADWRAA